MQRTLIAIGAALLLAATAHAGTYTYRYTGPTFVGGTDHVEVSFTTAAPLAPSRSFLHAADAGVVSGAVTVVGPAGVVSGFTLPLSTFQLHTSAGASAAVPGIDAWFVLGDASNLAGASPTATGVHFQSYTMNTMAFIPGSDVPGAVGLVTGRYNYDQGTQTTFYASCAGIAGCTLAGNGQPYVGNYSGIINPANTAAGNWTLTADGTPPPPPTPALGLTGSLPNGTVGVAYGSSALSAAGGVAPYAWQAVGLPAGLTINAGSGAVTGMPTTAGTFAFTVQVTDGAGTLASTALSVTIAPAAVVLACAGTNEAISGVNKWWLDIAGGLAGGGKSVRYTPTAAGTTFTGGTTTFVAGELVDYAGTVDGTGMCAATTMTVKPAPAPVPTYSCTKPAGARSVQGKNRITAVGSGWIVVGTVRVQVPSCATVSWNGAKGFAVGQRAEYQGYAGGGTTVAQKLTIN